MDQKLTTVHVKNLGKDVSRDELVDLFGLDKPELVRNTTQINIVHGASANTAILEVIETKYEELVKLSGITFKGRDFTICCDDSTLPGASSSSSSAPDDMETNDDNGEIMYMQIDVRIPEWNFRQVTDLEVVEALELEFANDATKSVEDLGRYKKSLQGIFRVDSADYSIYTGATLTVRDRQIPFTPWRQTPNNAPRGPSFGRGRREGTLITIYQAFRLEHREIENDKFDQAFEALNVEVIKPTLPQLRKGTSVLNNNRYLVVEKLDDKEDLRKRIGSRVVVEGTTFNIVYDGMQRHCWTCMKTHGSHCPLKARNDFLRQQRQTTGKRKIYSTSTLRHANQLALNSDVACMSGGGIGQILNAIQHDDKHDEVIIAAGTNELVRSDDLNEFVYTVEKSVDKLRAIAEEVSTSLVMPSIPLVTPQLKAKFDFLEEKARSIEKLKVIKPTDIEYAGIHPTEDGTRNIIKVINESFSSEIVVDGAEDEDLTRRRYQQVQALYKVGCRACDAPEFTPYLCGACRTAAESVDISVLQERIEKETNEQFPPMEEDPESKKNKRSISDDDEDGKHPAKR